MKDSLGMWVALLRATGRVLVPEKCFWYFIRPVWHQQKGTWDYEDPDPGHYLKVPDDTGKLEEIPQVRVSEARCTLGVHLAPNGNDNTEYQYLLEVSQQWQSSMATTKVMHSAVEFWIWQMILQKLVYPLVMTTFTKQQCVDIMHPILTQGLPSARFVRPFPWAIVHGPWQWGGLNIPNLYTEQLITHIQLTPSIMGSTTIGNRSGRKPDYLSRSSLQLCDTNMALPDLGHMPTGKHSDHWLQGTICPPSRQMMWN